MLVLTEDDFFLLGVRRVVTLPNRVWHATSEAQAADMLLSTPCAVALLDFALIRKELEAVARRLRQQFPDLGFVVTGEPEDEARVSATSTPRTYRDSSSRRRRRKSSRRRSKWESTSTWN